MADDTASAHDTGGPSEQGLPPAGVGHELKDGLTPEALQIASGQSTGAQRPANMETILRIPVHMQVVLGSAKMPVASLMKLGRGAIVPLDRRVGEPVDVVVNGRIIARGEVVVVDDDTSRFGISLTEIVGAAALDPEA